MQRLNSHLLILLFVTLLVGCDSRTQIKSLEDYRMATDVPSASELTATAEAEAAALIPPVDCPVTTSENGSFRAPEPYAPIAPWKGIFWYGAEELWTALPTDGVWWGLPDNPGGFTQKIMWWSDSYVLKDELKPALLVIGQRLDAESPPLKFYGATNAFADDIGEAMLTGVDFPTLGCWEITGQYKKSELTFVVWIAP